jgi:hypothetical protein
MTYIEGQGHLDAAPRVSPLARQVADLLGRLTKLSAGDQRFAASLCEQFGRRGLSGKQAHWVGVLLERAERPEPESKPVGDMGGLVALLERAKQHLKRPAIVVRANDRDLRLSIAGPSAKVPGAINVCSTGRWGDRDWYGRVTPAGQFEPSRKYDDATLTGVATALQAMADDPAKAAGDYGRLTGVCCFCSIALTDGRSTEVGYGPVCADHYGLPWGNKRRQPTGDAAQLDLAA